VLDTVYELFSEHGIEGISMRQVGDVAGLSTGTINYHFGINRSLAQRSSWGTNSASKKR
jgi:hypothetical protein